VAPRSVRTSKSGKGVAERREVKEEQLRAYELMLVLSPEVIADQLDAVLDNLKQLITGFSGVVSSVEQWGNRKLAYPVRGFVQGNYVLFQIQLKPAQSREMEAKLHISEDVIRHLLMKQDN
jgi:small subunit ribosomal protein S6